MAGLSFEDGRKYIAPKHPESKIMLWVFERIADGNLTTEQVLKQAREKGLNCSKNNFWVAIRNPVYCGKIFIEKFKDEDIRLVPGQHEPIISETLFYEAQDVLDGKKKKQRTKVTVDDRIPLLGFLVCPKCGRLLTGSSSKGRKERYYYYLYSSSCVCGIGRILPISNLFGRLRSTCPIRPLPSCISG
jgi:site-specific DNA recombinase